MTHHWEWLVPRDGQASAPHHLQVPLLPHPTLLTLTYSDEPSEDGTPWTRLEVTHERLPATWAPLMQSVWKARMSVLPAWALRW